MNVYSNAAVDSLKAKIKYDKTSLYMYQKIFKDG